MIFSDFYTIRFVAFYTVLILLGGRIFAAIEFDKSIIEDSVSPGVETYSFSFGFINNGEFEVKIKEIITSCGCTVAAFSKENYAPGETGSLEGEFQIGSRRGDQDKYIVVKFEDGLSDVKLHLRLSILNLATVDKSLLVWRSTGESDLKEKKVNVELNEQAGAELLSVKVDGSGFDVETNRVVDGEIYVIAVRPELGVVEAKQARIVITTGIEGEGLQEHIVHTLIR